MHITQGHLEAARGHSVAVRPSPAAYAPVSVTAALTALVGDPWQVKASWLGRENLDGATTWQGLWLTATHLASVRANRADDPDWDGESHHQQESEPMTGWLRPLTGLQDISATLTTGPVSLAKGTGGWIVRPRRTLVFAAATAVQLPAVTTVNPSDDVDDFVAAVRTAWTSTLPTAS